jgi:hypothetical protein
MMYRFSVLIPLATTLLLASCSWVGGSGVVVNETRPVSNFNRIELNGVGELTIVQGEAESLTIEAESNIVRRIKTDVQGSTLTIEFSEGLLGKVIPTEPIRYQLSVKDITGLALSGAGRIYSSRLATSELEIDVSGVGDVIIDDLQAGSLSVNLNGAGTIDLAGSVSDQDVELTTVGNYSAAGLQSQRASIRLSGAGTATLLVIESLQVEISGVGSVNYYGNPNVTSKISGLGKLNYLGKP